MSTALNLENLDVSYGAIQALRGVTVTVNQGEIVTLIGANGAGKSTLLRAASGMVRAKSGRVEFLGDSPVNRIDCQPGLDSLSGGTPDICEYDRQGKP
jgi:branched-chain amino acid transport system ATP-binding protein